VSVGARVKDYRFGLEIDLEASQLTTTSLRAACISREPLDESEKGSGESEGEDPKRRRKVPKVSNFARLSGGAAAMRRTCYSWRILAGRQRTAGLLLLVGDERRAGSALL
jgi:hypothetical protein